MMECAFSEKANNRSEFGGDAAHHSVPQPRTFYGTNGDSLVDSPMESHQYRGNTYATAGELHHLDCSIEGPCDSCVLWAITAGLAASRKANIMVNVMANSKLASATGFT